MRISFLLLAGFFAGSLLRADDAASPSPFGVPSPGPATSTNAPAAPAAPAVPADAGAPDDSPLIDDTPSSPSDPIKRFDGHMTLTTADFTVPDGWELRWRSDQVLSVGVIRLDNTVVAGTTGRTVGSLYVPQGGCYRLRIKTSMSVPWDVSIYPVSTAPPDESAYMPTVGPAFKPIVEPAAPPPPPAPPVAVAPKAAPPVAAPVPADLTPEQRLSLVTIKGDRMQGSGFFMKHGTETVLVTTQHLIGNNPNWQAVSANGTPVQVLQIRGATDRDVAMLSVKDFGYSALPEGDPMKLQAGDKLLTLGHAAAPVTAAVDSIDAQRIALGGLHAVEGSPLILAATGHVVGLVAVGPQIAPADNFAPNTFTARDTAVVASTVPYGERLDDVASWETCVPAQLQAEAQFIAAFSRESRQLDAYLNGMADPRSLRMWRGDDKIKGANDTFVQDTPDGNTGQRTQSLHALVFELSVLCDADLDQMQQPSNFYGYQRRLAQVQVAYRMALKAQIDDFTSDTSRFDPIVRRNTDAE